PVYSSFSRMNVALHCWAQRKGRPQETLAARGFLGRRGTENGPKLSNSSQTAPRKQRHTARRIYQRLREEHGYEGAESTIRRVVAQLRRELEMDVLEPFFVLSSDPGEMAQVDWGQAKVMLAGVPTVVHLFCLRLHYSGVAFVWASLHEKLEAFLEGHVQA